MQAGRGHRIADWWNSLRKLFVRDIPASLEACESCRDVSCTQAQWLACRDRLQTEAEVLAARAMSSTARTEELPGLTESGEPVGDWDGADEAECAEHEDPGEPFCDDCGRACHASDGDERPANDDGRPDAGQPPQVGKRRRASSSGD